MQNVRFFRSSRLGMATNEWSRTNSANGPHLSLYCCDSWTKDYGQQEAFQTETSTYLLQWVSSGFQQYYAIRGKCQQMLPSTCYAYLHKRLFTVCLIRFLILCL